MKVTNYKILSLLLLLFVVFQSSSESFSQLSGCANIELGSDFTMDCTDGCVTLEAEVVEVGLTTQYDVTSIPHDPPYPYDQGTAIFVGQDDTFSEIVTLPFDFCFFGNTYNEIVVGANGVLSFDVGLAGGYCDWQFDQTMPNAFGVPYQNSINGAYHDIDPSVGGEIKYAILGDYPCRTFIVSYYNVPHYQCNSIFTTQQIVLYETTNIIDVYIADKPTCGSWNSGNAVIGIQNAQGTIGYVPPGRNTGPWSTSNEAWRFSPSGTGVYTVNWYDDSGILLGSGDNIEVCPTVSTTYTADVVYDICDGTQVVETDDIEITMLGEVTTSLTTVVSCDSYLWNNVNYNSSGIHTYTTTNSQGCDSIATLDLTINLATYSINTAVSCSSYDWNGNTYDQTGVYQFIMQGSTGCDSVSTLELTIIEPSSSLTVIEQCEPFDWNGTTYSTSGTYTFTTMNAVGCDSVATLDLTIHSPTSSLSSHFTCMPYDWNGTTYTSSGLYTFNTVNSNGCDSTATLDLTIQDLTESFQSVNACEQYIWNGNTYNSSGLYTYQTINDQGCDSIASLSLTINTSTSSLTEISSCEPLDWNGNTYSVSGNYTHFTTNSNGCDSIAYLDFTMLYSTTSLDFAEACGEYYWNGVNYTETGVYEHIGINSMGCDSIANLDLVINPLDTLDLSVEKEACNEFTWNEVTYTESGEYSFSTSNIYGCDSTVTLYLTVYKDRLFVPNSFTPDNDGVNDVFTPVGEDVDLTSFNIYNRWGDNVFSADTLDTYGAVWNGTLHGGSYLCPDGTYSWHAIYKCLSHTYEKYGHVNLFR